MQIRGTFCRTFTYWYAQEWTVYMLANWRHVHASGIWIVTWNMGQGEGELNMTETDLKIMLLFCLLAVAFMLGAGVLLVTAI